MAKMINSYWVWLLLTMVVWIFAFLHMYTDSNENISWRIISCTGFFICFFLSPLFHQKPLVLSMILGFAVIFATITFWPEKDSNANTYTLLVFAILFGKTTYRLPFYYALSVAFLLLLSIIAPVLMGYPTFPLFFLLLFMLLLSLACFAFGENKNSRDEALERNIALLSEYRQIKRCLIVDEESARQEERTQIARDIHDSVGHKLTALLIQLEVFRMKVDNHALTKQIQDLKGLARESLDETRLAVTTLRQQETGGLTAILRLIRQLETEQIIRIQFSVKQGALSTPLSNEQSIAIYRNIQEALTNVMRHAKTREAEVLFEAPGGSIFRFEISNDLKETIHLREGFGITTMRERMEKLGGSLEVLQHDKRFIVRGTFSLLKNARAE